MGRKVNWFCSVNKALSSKCKDSKDQRSSKTRKKWFVKKKSSHPISVSSTTTTNNTTTTTTTIDTATTTTTTSTTIASSPPVAVIPVEVVKPLPILPSENVKVKEEEDEQKKHAQSIAIATAKAAEAAAAAAQAAAEVVRLTSAAQFPGKLKEEAAALRIQTSFRRYLARRALCTLRGLASLKIVMQGESMKRQTTNTFKSMQSLVRVQSQVRDRRLRISSDNQAPKALILEKQVKELHKVESLQHNVTGWDASPKSKEQMEARLQSQHEAAMRRDRALAYSLNHQKTRRNSPTARSAKTNIFVDSKNHHSGWSWLERWLAARPWETASDVLDHRDHAFLRTSTGSEIAKAILQHVSEKQTSASSSPRSLNSSPKAAQRRRTSTGRLSISAPSKTRLSSRKPKIATKAITSPRRSMCCPDGDEDARSSVGGDDNDNNNNNNDEDDSLVTSPAGQAVPSYMVPTESARAKSRLGSTLNTDIKHETMDRLSVCSAKKRASSPARSRNSVSSITDAISIADQQSLINAM